MSELELDWTAYEPDGLDIARTAAMIVAGGTVPPRDAVTLAFEIWHYIAEAVQVEHERGLPPSSGLMVWAQKEKLSGRALAKLIRSTPATVSRIKKAWQRGREYPLRPVLIQNAFNAGCPAHYLQTPGKPWTLTKTKS